MDSTELFARRKEAKDLPPGPKLTALLELKPLGLRLVAYDDDTWNQRALAWILIDLCKLFANVGNYPQAQSNYAELVKLTTYDDIIGGQQEYLEKVVDPFHEQVKALNQKSKDGHHDEAVNGFSSMLAANQLSPVHHESYGWAIYRLLKAKAEEYTSVQVRRWLKHYLDLKNERPSMVHSQILNWTMKYAENDPNLRGMDFLKIWDATKFQHEDFRESTMDDGTKISPLFARVCRRLVNDDHGVDVAYLLAKVNTAEDRILDTLRQQFFWRVLKAGNENNYAELWPLLNEYLNTYASYPASHWHSEVLQLAERFMKEGHEHRFLPFFKNWNPVNFRKEDWKETKNGEATYPPLAQKALKKACTVALKATAVTGSLDWLVTACTKAVKQLPHDEYLPRNRAQLLKHNGQTEAATAAYRDLTLTLGDKFYVWKEFADLIDTEQRAIKAGMLAKALTIERNEDFIGDVRLSLAERLLALERPAEANLELDAYHANRVKQGWQIDERYTQLKARLANLEFESLTRPNYTSLIEVADEYAYAAVPWTTVTLTDRWKNDKGQDKVKLHAGAGITLSVTAKRFPELKKAKPGTTLEIKLHKGRSKDGTHDVYRPLLIRNTTQEPWSALPSVYAVVDYVNKDRQVVHAVTQDGKLVFFPANALRNKPVKGQFLNGRLLVELKPAKENLFAAFLAVKQEERLSLMIPEPVTKEIAQLAFPEYLALVDSVNAGKKLFHFVTDSTVDGIVYFSDTDLRPVPGDHYMIRGYPKLNTKTGKTRLSILNISPTEEVLKDKIKHLHGVVEVVWKNGKTFGFVSDTYVPGYLLSGAGIFEDSVVSATAIYGDGKWRVVSIEVL